MIGWLFDWKLDELQRYMLTLRDALNERLDALGAKFDDQTKYMTDEQRAWEAEWYAAASLDLTKDFPALIWKTSFIQMYFHLEDGLSSLCKTVQSALRQDKSVTGRDKGISAARTYLEKAGVAFPFEGPVYGPMWRDILAMNELRNILAHAMGQIETEPSQELRSYLNRQKDLIRLNNLGEVVLTEQYCFNSIDRVREFFKEILKAVPDRMIP